MLHIYIYDISSLRVNTFYYFVLNKHNGDDSPQSGQNKMLLTFTETSTQSFIKISSGSTVYNIDELTNMNSLYELRAKNYHVGEYTVVRNRGLRGRTVSYCIVVRSGAGVKNI